MFGGDKARSLWQMRMTDHAIGDATDIFLSSQNIPGDHPAVEILNDLDRIAYSRLNANHSHSIPCLVPYTLRPILRWATMLNNRLKVDVLYMFKFLFFF